MSRTMRIALLSWLTLSACVTPAGIAASGDAPTPGVRSYGTADELHRQGGVKQPSTPTPARTFRMGFTTEPQSSSDTDFLGPYKVLLEHADLVTHYFAEGVPWPEALLSSNYRAYSENLQKKWLRMRATDEQIIPGYDRYIVISAISTLNSLSPYWGEQTNMPLPSPWDHYALNHPNVKTAMVNYAVATIEFFQPKYLGINFEANILLARTPWQWEAFKDLNAYVYTTLKQRYPEVTLFSTVHYEHLLGLHDASASLKELLKDDYPDVLENEVRELLQHCDLFAISTYPYMVAGNLVTEDYYEAAFAIAAALGKPLAIDQTGYISRDFYYEPLDVLLMGSDELQGAFLGFLLAEARELEFEFVANFVAWDYGEQFGTDPVNLTWARTGLVNTDGTEKLAMSLWDAFRALPYVGVDGHVEPLVLTSPNGALTVEIRVDRDNKLYYALMRGSRILVSRAPLGVTVDSVDLGAGATDIGASEYVEVDESYPVLGAYSLAQNRYNTSTLTIGRAGSGDASYQIELRLYDDGVAYRYMVPGSGDRTITEEASAWRLPPHSTVWYQVDTENYELPYNRQIIGTFAADIGGPLTVELPDSGFLTLSEAGVVSYSGMTYRAELDSTMITSRFLDDAAWTVPGGTPTPWRLAIVSEDLNGLVNTAMVTSLNEAPDSGLFPNDANTDWLRPGRAVWSWWSDFNSGLSFEVQKEYVDHAHALGFEYSLVDAGWEIGFPENEKNQFQRLRDLVDYAHSGGRGVDIWVWKELAELSDPAVRQDFWQAVTDAGALGVKIDNLSPQDSDSVATNRLIEAVLQETAEFELMVNLHGVPKPTGLSRTYPNNMTHEGFIGLEMNSFWDQGFFLSPEHNATLPFVRFVVGPGDYTPVTFDSRKLGDTTFAHQLATVGLFPSPVLHFADDPAILRAQTDMLDLLNSIPPTWDEQVVLPQSKIGDLAVFARRKGDEWYLFIINGDGTMGESLNDISLSFLGSHEYDAILIADDTPTRVTRQTMNAVTGADTVNVDLLPGGGFVAWLRP